MKTKITILALLISAVSFSQKQDAGDIPIELEFAPLGASPLKIASLRARYFKSDDIAFRMSLYLGGSSKPTYSKPNDVELVSKTSDFNFVLRPGIEKHFEGTDNLSPYIGGELSYGYKRNSSYTESNWSSNSSEIKAKNSVDSKSTFGMNVLTGADYYITDKIYLGVELGFGFQYEGRGGSSVVWENPENSSESDSDEIGNSSNFQWGPNYQATIRLGYCLKNKD
jgi:opacity protein-like surface antigen